MSEVDSTECKMSEVALLAPTYEEIKMSEVALLAPTYEYGYVGFVGLFYHSGSSITRGLGDWKGKVGAEQYVSCMFQFLVYFSVFSCQNCGIVRIAEGTEDAEDTEGREKCQNCGIVRITEGTEDAEERGVLSEPRIYRIVSLVSSVPL